MLGSASSERIAIVGVGGIFPGAPDLDTFWRNVSCGIDSGRHVPAGRWYLSPEKAYAHWPPKPDRVYSTWGCFIEGFEFDPDGLDLEPDFLARLDPMFHLGLHAARAAYRDAKLLAGIDHTRVGVILGNIALPTESTSAICRDILGRTFVEKLIDTAAAAAQQDGAAPWTTALSDPAKVASLKASLKRSHWDPRNRFAAGLPSSLIAQGLGFGGIAFTLDAACASSLYSLKFAAEELLSHRADAMLAGGMSRPDCQYTQMGFAQLQALSRQGRCAPLSAAADGLVVGEGAGVFVLKRLSDAVAQGDHIYGVIAGIGLSNDRGANLLAPHSEGQLRAMRSAYDQAGWKPSDIDLIECHATGTPVGDAVEISSLHQLWEHESARPHQCVIGGVKSNVGHLLTGAGAAGLMKVLYALKHQTLPPTANFSQPAERLAASDSPFRVLSQSEPWQRRTVGNASSRSSSNDAVIPRRATINAFGFGGINAHVLIEEWNEVPSSIGVGGLVGNSNSVPSTQYSVLSTEQTVGSATGVGSDTNSVGWISNPSVKENVSDGLEIHPTEDIPIAIVGLDAHVGTWETKQVFQENDFQGKQLEFVELNWWGVEQSSWFQREQIADDFGRVPTQPVRPVGHAITEVRLPMGKFRIPPLEMQDMLPQQQVMLKVAARALHDADRPHVFRSEHSQQTQNTGRAQLSNDLANRTGVIVGIELDPNTTNFHFRWSVEQDAESWAQLLGLDLTTDELTEWTTALKAAASPPLSPNGVMGNLGGIVASRLAREFDVGGPSFTVSCGALSDVVARELGTRTLQRFELDRVIVGGVMLSADPRWHAFVDQPPMINGCPSETPAEDFINHYPDMAEAIVLCRSKDAIRRGDRSYAVIKSRARTRDSVENRWVELPLQFSGNRIVGNSIDKLPYLYQSCLRAVGLTSHIVTNDEWSTGNLAQFYPLRKEDRTYQVRAIDARKVSNRETTLETPEITNDAYIALERRRPIGELPFAIFIVRGKSVQELMNRLDKLEVLAQQPGSIEQLARSWFEGNLRTATEPHVMVLLAVNAAELKSSVAQGQLHLQQNPATRFITKQISYSPSSDGTSRRIGFVFPGSGNAFRGMALTLLSVFPEIIRRQQEENEDLPTQLGMKSYWRPRYDQQPIDHKSMIFSQVAIGAAICDLLALFGVRPSASIGYSLGESAAFFGLRAWTDRDDMLKRMERASLFGSDLVAPFNAARRAWNIPDSEPVPWLSGVIDRSANDVRAAIDRMRAADAGVRLYLLIVNTPRQCVIGGERDRVEQLVQQLNANFVPLPSPSTVHCEVLRQVEGAYRELHLMPTQVPMVETDTGTQPIDFYSTAWGHTYPLSRESAAEAIVAQAVDTIDFPRVIEQAYADGVGLFVEIGPGSSCTKMIDEILGDRPHLAKPALPMTSRPVEAFFELLAALIAEGVPVDLSYLYGQPLPGREDSANPPAREVVTKVGGSPFQIPAPPGGWKFKPTPVPAASEPVAASTSLPPSKEQARASRPLAPREEGLGHEAETPNTFETLIESPLAQREANDTEYESLQRLWDQFQLMNDQRTQAHEAFLRLSAKFEHLAAEQLALLARAGVSEGDSSSVSSAGPSVGANPTGFEQTSTQYSVLSTEVARGGHDSSVGWISNPSVSESHTDGLEIHPTESPPAAHVPHAAPTAPEATPSTEYSVLRAQHSSLLGNNAAGTCESQPAPSSRLGESLALLAEPFPVMPVEPPRSLNRAQCMEFAIGKIGRVLGQKFAEIDQHPTRVRLPDEPLMLVDRILEIEGEPLSMTSGRVVTEHDVLPGAWYLDCDRIPTCVAVEAGQADLFLSGWLGIDLQTKGVACYRLLDAVVTFHDELPQPGQVIHYDIKVLHFFRQGNTYLFRFEFDATVDGKPLMTMREGCAGFFTDAELAGGKGIIHTALDKRPRPGIRPDDWSDPVPMSVESYDDNQLLALRRGDLATCFGPAFAGLPLRKPVTLPGLTDAGARTRMWLVDRVLKLDPSAGKFGMGTILGELDIHPDDWFLTCHFCDDQVMPGTLMYECCMHTLRILLLRMGWIGESGEIAYEPIPGVRSRLKCRGQVLASTKKVWYEVTLKEVGYGRGDASSAYCLADALMYADGKPIVEITDMSVKLTGLSREAVDRLWARRPASAPVVATPRYDRRPALFDTDRITAYAIGKPSDAFGDKYRPFDEQRKIARLPGPPFQFLDRVVSIQNCQQWVLQAGGEIVAQYDVPVDAWYFASNRQRTMPFAVLLETALQPCGWLAGYLGSALTSDIDLSFRNLGGTATQYRDVTPMSGTLSTTVKMTRVSNSAGMIIQHYDFDLRCDGEPVYVGNTYFGFFSKAALSNQVGIREAIPYQPTSQELAVAKRGAYPQERPFSDSQFRMIQNIEALVPNGGPYGKGCIIGTMPVDPTAWFFKAHFYQDPVVPGSLGLESFWQLLKVFATDRWQLGSNTEFSTPVIESPAQTSKHEWVYRGQVIPADTLVTVTAVIREIDDARRTLTAEGYLSVDGRVIYQMKNFTMGCHTA